MPITTTELGMSACQGEILQLILCGLPNKTIAQTLSLSESTVKEHITVALRKPGVKTASKPLPSSKAARLCLAKTHLVIMRRIQLSYLHCTIA
jgi:DNA-binding NarL/FixJ family response regulator